MGTRLARGAFLAIALTAFGFSSFSFGLSKSTIGIGFWEEGKSGGWSMNLDETEEAHGVYESLLIAPDCDATGRCWKRLRLTNGFYLNAMKLASTSRGHRRMIYSLTLGQPAASLAEYSKLAFPLRVTMTEPADQDLLIDSIDGVRFGVELLSNRFRIYCSKDAPVPACYMDVRDLNYSALVLGKRKLDAEKVSRGTSYSTQFMPDWNVEIVGPAADRLYDGILGDGGPYLSKQVQLTPTVSIDCMKSRRPVDPSSCVVRAADKSKVGFTHPDTFSVTFPNSIGAFGPSFSYKSGYALLSIECPSPTGKDGCELRIF